MMIKMHWAKKMFNDMKKPMSSTGENGDRVFVHWNQEDDSEEDTFRILGSLIG